MYRYQLKSLTYMILHFAQFLHHETVKYVNVYKCMIYDNQLQDWRCLMLRFIPYARQAKL